MEDSGQGDGSGEQSEETAGRSESTEGSEERGLGQADADDSEGHCGKSSTAQVPVNANQQVSGHSKGLKGSSIYLKLD